ncbi:uncharacterized protein RHOBADRAFT_51419 [Rhodotorula graminis WP1]|uniref:PH domain-containing protein n=1 Tax=Rhodotorula graminis (strain WP1) TaxID=578459 RepID=A0A194SDT8_RHOGW|nr:uncharacterized protein RHOBADRAFT_51419 [Rhodotorula graminis WP1]KPV77586.1 hypothetical protein RHOBADRAFT_51419 [Rhodotorula graminis WP1]
MDGPPASSASTSFARATGPTLEQRTGSAPPSPVPLVDHEQGQHRHLYTQPDYAVKTKDERLPELETKHAGLTALRRVFIGPSFHRAQGGGGGPFASAHGGGGSGGGKGKARAAEGSDGEQAHAGMSFPLRRRRRASTSATNRTGISVGSSTHGDSSRGGWHGASFEIGGDVRDAARRRDARLARQRDEDEGRPAADRERDEAGHAHEHEGAPDVARSLPRSPALTTRASFVTARTHLPPSTAPDRASTAAPTPQRTSSLAHAFHHRPVDLPDILVTGDAASDGALEAPKRRPDLPHLQSILRTRDALPSPSSRLATSAPVTVYGDAVSHQEAALGVRFPDEPATVQPLGAGSGAAPPAPPLEVLARPEPDAEPDAPPSSTARLVDGLRHPLRHEAAPARRKTRPGDAVLRQERMLVRVDWTQREDLPDDFDEHVARKYPTSKEAWEEVAVVWRASGQIELWGEYSLNIPATVLHRKKLKTVIPLTARKTHLSVYSSTDLIFCLTHRPHSHSRSSAKTAVRAGKPDERTVDKGDDGKDEPRSRKASKRGRLHFRTEGTNIFLFRTRTHAIAKEWVWRLYRALGGQLPRTLDVSVPGLGAVVRLPVPTGPGDDGDDEDEVMTGDEDERAYRHLQPQVVVDACVAQLASVPEWREVVETAKRDGAQLRLAWRRESTLDWVGKGHRGEKKRDWAVIGGFAFRQAHLAPVLELRPAMHYPTTCRIPAEPGAPNALHSTTTRISEPPGIEGFLIRHRPNGTAERIYLSSRMGMLFLCRSSTAHPPDPPMNVYDALNNPAAVVLAPFVFAMATLAAPSKKKRDRLWGRISRGAVVQGKAHKHARRRDWTLKSMTAADAADEVFHNGGDLDIDGGTTDAGQCDGNDMLEWLDRHERERGFLQVTDAHGFVDLSELETIDPELEDQPRDQFVQVHDVGGQGGLNVADDKAKLRRLRSFVVKTRSGMAMRFECHSIDVRDEWVGRLRALVTYWRRRERVDAIQLMSLSPGDGLVNKLPPRSATQKFAWNDDFDDGGAPPPTRNEILASPQLGHVYNWCLLDGCRAVMHKGAMHVKKGLRGTFHPRHVVLLPGVLVEFQSVTRDLQGRPKATPYHRRRHVLTLRDCYIYSGSLASHLLAPSKGASTWDPADESAHQLPRYYSSSDGLRTADDVEDCTFAIVRVKHSRSGKLDKLDKKVDEARVYRARSKLERDQFVYALNASIERIMRGEREREDRLRDFPWAERT